MEFRWFLADYAITVELGDLLVRKMKKYVLTECTSYPNLVKIHDMHTVELQYKSDKRTLSGDINY